MFAASLVSLIQRRRGQILFSTATMSAVAFCFVLPSLVMEELLFNQLHKSVSTKDGAVVSWGIPRYLLIITVITTFVAAISGFIAARMALADKGKGHYATLQHPMPLAPYSNLDKQYGQGGVRERDPDAPYDPVGTHDAFSMVPSPTGSPAPGQQGQQGQYANPYDRERY